jgi:hypothetical protein
MGLSRALGAPLAQATPQMPHEAALAIVGSPCG